MALPFQWDKYDCHGPGLTIIYPYKVSPTPPQNLLKMPEGLKENLQPSSGELHQSEKDVSAKALELLRNESQKDLLNSLASTKLAKPIAPASEDPHAKGYLQTGINSVTSLVIHDDQTRGSVNHYAAELVKTASLFTGGKLGFASTAIAYGLDQTRTDSSWKEQVADFTLGAAKGSTMKGMFQVIGASGQFAPMKGALMGMGSGAADEVFKRETFTNPSSLNDRLRQTAFNPQAVLMNAVLFTAGEGVYSGINNFAYKGALTENRMLSNMIMGGSFGFVNGTVAEASRQQAETGKIDYTKVVLKGLLESGVSAAGAGIGTKVSDPVFQQKVKDTSLSTLDNLGLMRHSREFIVTGGMAELDKFTSEQTRTAITTVREVRNILGWERVGPEKHLMLQHSDQKAGSIPIPKLADMLASCNPEKLGAAERASHLFSFAKGPVFLERGAENHIRISLGDQAPQWKNGVGGNRIMLGSPESKINAMAPLLIGDPKNPDGEASKNAWNEFTAQLQQARKIGIDGISTDVWWGVVEPKQGQFQWKYYDKLSSQIIGNELKWVPILSFHSAKAGGNIGDNVDVPVPFWAWNKVASQIPGSSPDVGMFKSEQGNPSTEYIQFWADKQAVPLYRDVMVAFGNHFAPKAPHMSEINISLGPAGEARYPSYNHHDQNVGYPSRGALQSYSDLAKADFKDWVMKKYGDFDGVNKAWGGNVQNIEPPVNVDAFFKDNVHTNTQYGKDYFDWYNQTLVKHIHTVMGTAFDVFNTNSPYKNTNIGMKIPGIHWRIGTNAGDHIVMSDRLAELTAGMITTSQNDWHSDELGRGYRPLLSGIKQVMSFPGGDRLTLHFTALEMYDGQDGSMNAKAMPYTLANWVGREAQRQGIPLKGENALGGTLQDPASWQRLASHLRMPGQEGYYNGLTLLRLSDVLGSDVSRYHIQQLIKATGGKPTEAARKNAS